MKRKPHKAAQMYTQAHEGGNKIAACFLGFLYPVGWCLEKKLGKAAQLYMQVHEGTDRVTVL